MTECAICSTNFLEGETRCQKCGRHRADVEVASPERAPESIEQERYAQTLAALRQPPRTLGAKWFWVSLVAYALAVGWDNWELLLLLIPVLFIHEMGHYVAMRVFGQSDARIFFLPFFGAVTTSRIRNQHAWQRAVVLLAGPVPGIVLGAALMQVEGMSRAWGAGFLIINGLNLLPFAFLDGGRLVTTLFSTRSGILEASVSIVPGIGVALYAFIAKDWLLLLLCYVAVGSGIRQLTVARAANKLVGELPLRIEDCSDEQLRMVYGAIDGNLRPVAAAETMRELHARKHNQRPSPLARAAILAGYLSSAALVCVVWFWR